MSVSFLATASKNTNSTGSTWLIGLSQSARYNNIHRASFLQDIGFYQNISSSRVFSSSRVDSTLIFFGAPINWIHFPDFTGRFLQITDDKNSGMPEDVGQFSNFSFNDATQSILAVGPNKDGFEFRLSFRDLFLDKWNTFLDAELNGSQARRDGNPTLTWEMWPENISYLDPARTYLKIHQDVNIVLDWWPDYDASITYHIYLYLNASGKLRGYVQRWAYWVEGGIKSSEIASRLRPKVISGMAKLNTKLNEELAAFSNITFRDLYYLPGNQTSRPPSGVVTGWTTEDTTIVLVI